MKIGIVGAGGLGQAFARHVIRAGYEVIISNSRGPESLSDLVKSLKGNVKAGTVQDAVDADVVFLAVQWKHIQKLALSVTSWEGRIVIDPTNPIITPGFQIADLQGKLSSEVVSELLPGARLVKAFNTYAIDLLKADPHEAGGRRVLFFSGNHASAKTVVAGIIDKTGFAGIDLGNLNEGGKLQHFPGGLLLSNNLIKLT